MEAWEGDKTLSARLKYLVTRSYSQQETLQFISSEFSAYKWSLRTLQRRLNYFGITRNKQDVAPKDLVNIVQKEVEGAGGLLGYRALHRKIRNQYGFLIPQKDVYLAMNLVCPEKLEERRLTNKRKKFHKRVFKSKGPNWVWSIDGHDKLSGRNKSEFPFGVHGCIDTLSRKVMWLKVWPSNCNPELPAKLFFDAIVESGYVPSKIRSDRGGENVIVATMQNFLTRPDPGQSNHIFGSSITNQVIEQWWRGFRERHGEFFKAQIHDIALTGSYDEDNSTCRVLMAFVYIPIIQVELDNFKLNWNSHRIRKQDIYRPCGIPNFLYQFPEPNGGVQCGMVPNVNKMEFIKAQVHSHRNLKFIDPDLEIQLCSILSHAGIQTITINNAKRAYMILLDKLHTTSLEFTYS